MHGKFSTKFQTSLLLCVLKHLIVEEEHVLHLTLVLEDWEHWLIIALDGVPSVCFNKVPLFLRNTTECSVYSFKKKLDLYLSTVPDVPCQPGFNNSLDHGECLRWRTPRDGLADN